MDITKIREEFDRLLKECRLSEAETLMETALSQARETGRNDIALAAANELMGYYRDCGRFDKSLEMAELSENLLEKTEHSPEALAAALLNSANAARAAGQLQRAYEYYERIKNIPETFRDKSLKASYYNNLALLHQEAGKWQEAANCLRTALSVAEAEGDRIHQAISRSNLAACLVKTGDVIGAKDMLTPALAEFSGLSPSDFHYSAALAVQGDIRLSEGEYAKAALSYEAALSEIEMHMGRNNFYDTVNEKLHVCYEKTPRFTKLTKGLDISRAYYNAFGKPVLDRNFPDMANKTACGLAGEGSECLGFDDDISHDHDFAPSFCIWVNDLDHDIPKERAEEMQRAYEALPGTFMGLSHNETEEGRGRRGVILLSEFLKKFTGQPHLPENDREWLDIPDEDIACIVNGRVFEDSSGFFTDIRNKLRNRPRWVTLAKLTQELDKSAKHGQSNYPRAVKRGDTVAAYFELSEFMKSVLAACHLIEERYAPYQKWLMRSCRNIPGYEEICGIIEKIAAGENISDNIEKVCGLLEKRLIARHIITEGCGFLKQTARVTGERVRTMAAAEDVIRMEWAAFDKTQNKGGRADCQDDWETFSIMRRGQYYSFPCELVMMIRADFAAAAAGGRNVITEKYGYMMETSAPSEFAEIAGKLPQVSEKKRALCGAILPIQVGWMEDFASRYPKLAGQARVIHTEDDTAVNVSYETYLRGELYTYSDDTLETYGRFIVSVYQRGENLAENIMREEVYMYGYDSLDEAEAKLG